MILAITTKLIETFVILLKKNYNELKHYLFLAINITFLMIGLARKNFLFIILSMILLIISVGAMRYKLEENKNGKEIHKTSKDKLVEPKKAK